MALAVKYSLSEGDQPTYLIPEDVGGIDKQTILISWGNLGSEASDFIGDFRWLLDSNGIYGDDLTNDHVGTWFQSVGRFA